MLTGFGLGAAVGGLLTMKWRIRRNAGTWIAVLRVVEGTCLCAVTVAVAPGVALAATGTSVIGHGATGLLIAAIGTTGTFALGGLLEVSVAATLFAPAYRRARAED